MTDPTVLSNRSPSVLLFPFVPVRLLTRNYLHLDQVEVYGEPLPNFPQPAPTLATAEQP